MGLRGKAMATLVASVRVGSVLGGEEEREEGVVGGLLGGEAVVTERLGVACPGGEIGEAGESSFDAHRG